MFIRKQAIIVILVVAVLAGAIFWFVKDGMFGRAVEYTLESMFGAKAEVSGLKLDLMDTSARFKGVRIADAEDPWFNLVDVGPAEFSVLGMQLFAKKLVIDKVTVDQLAFHTKRESSGELPMTAQEKAEKAAEKAAEEKAKKENADKDVMTQLKEGAGKLKETMPGMDLDALTKELDIERLVDPKGLASVRALEETEVKAKESYATWDKRIKENTWQQDFKKLEQQVDTVSKVDYKDVVALKKALDQAKQINGDAQKLQSDISTTQKQAQQDYDSLQKAVKNAQDMTDADVKAVRNLANLGSLDAKETGKILFGSAMMERLQQGMHYLAMARKFIANDEAEPEVPPRRYGRDIRFPVTSRIYPKFLIKTAHLSGVLSQDKPQESLNYSGTLTGLTSSARLYGEPTLLDMKMVRTDGKAWQVNGDFDHRQKVAVDRLLIKGQGMDLGAVDLKNKEGSMMPQRMDTGAADVDVNMVLRGEYLDAVMLVDARKVTFAFPAKLSGDTRTKRDLEQNIRELFKEFDHVTLKTVIKGPLDNPDLSVSSNVDKLFAARMKALLGKRMAEAEAKIRAEIDRQVKAKRAQVEQEVQKVRNRVESEVGKYKDKLAKVESTLKSKQAEIDKQIEKLKKEADKRKKELEQKAKDQLKNLVK